MSAVWENAQWDFYLNFLMPDKEQRQTIENSRVRDVLKNHGDSTDPREIYHWIDFPIATDRDQFQAKAERIGFQTRGLIEPGGDNHRYTNQMFRTDLPAVDTIDTVALTLFRLARERGGSYNGWETKALQ